MAFANNVMIVRQELLAKLVEMWDKGSLVQDIDRLPIKMSPRNEKVKGRCCVYKERAVWKYKSFPLMGFDMSDETDELTPLSWYAETALKRSAAETKKENLVCVIDVACSSCIKVSYEITELCRGCVARTCYMNCPKHAIFFNKEGKSEIDHDICISCGKCYQSCPYHAIVYIPVPCEEVCPVKAISKDENGIEHIDESKCIYCGKCINACPFGAIFEVSQVFDVLQGIREGKEMVAIVAPSVLSQFDQPLDKIYGAIKSLGFKDVIEVARGAVDTTAVESEELKVRILKKEPFMTTSCCPSWVELAKKHIPEIVSHISTAGSPMFYSAVIAKQKHPAAHVVFIGPCLAKKKEARDNNNVDFALTFEELGSVFAGLKVDFKEVTPFVPQEEKPYKEAYGFAQSGGVIGAVKYILKDSTVKTLQISNLDKKNISLLKVFGKTGKAPADLIEVMSCEGGCVTGPCIYNDKTTAAHMLKEALDKIK